MLHTHRSISDLRIVFSTFRRCMSFYTARVKRRQMQRSKERRYSITCLAVASMRSAPCLICALG